MNFIRLSGVSIVIFIVIGVFLTAMILFMKKAFQKDTPCKISINNQDNLTKIVQMGQTLLAALSDNKIAVPSPCGGKGACKQCRVQIIKGAEDILEIDKASFSPKELKAGWRLSCQYKLRHDVTIHLPEQSLQLREFVGKVVSNKNEATFIKELVIEIPEMKDFTYQAGDYLQFYVPKYSTNTNDWKKNMDETYFDEWEKFGMFNCQISHDGEEKIVRAYSFASYPLEKQITKYNIRIATPPIKDGKISSKIPWGICSSYLFSLQPEDTVKLSGPFGESHMIDDDREVIFLIGGAGSSFARSHILSLFYEKNTKREVTLWYGARALRENMYQKEYETLADQYSNFHYHLVLSNPLPEDIEQGWPKDDPIKTNFLFKAFEEGQLKNMEMPEECLYYVCGPPLHNTSIMKLLDNYGVAKENIVLDDFGS